MIALFLAIMFVLLGGGVAAAQPTFTDVTASIGINHLQSSTSGVEAMTGGVVAGDFDGDGRVDLFFTRVDAADILYRNTGSGFEDISVTAGFVTPLPSSGATSGDIDNDGDLDLYVTATSHNRFYLYINDGTGRFTEQAVSRGASVTGPGSITRRGMGVAMGDYDQDGYLDILTSDHSRPTATSGSRLLRNLGATNPGHFQDVTEMAGIDTYRQALAQPNTAYRFTPQFSDIDRDGHTDIVFSSDSRTSQLFWNNGNGTFTDGTLAAGVGTDKSGMGSALGDYDGDGDLDWFITAIFDTPFLGANPGNRLYRNDGDRTFTDVTSAAGVRNSGTGQQLSWGWGTEFLDHDNDGDLDLMMTNGFFLGYGGDQTTLRQNNGDGTFSDVSSLAGITDTAQGRGLIRVDYDQDGDLDVVIVNHAAQPIVYRNDGGNDLNWFRAQPEGTISNRDAIGTLIKVIPDASVPDEFQIVEIRSGDSYLSQNELTAHFGLGDHAGTIDLVEITWPASKLVQRYVDLPVNMILRDEERLIGDFNGNAIVDAADFTIWRDSLGMSGVGLPADGAGPFGIPDGIVDDIDYRYWRANFGATLAAGAQAVPEPGGAFGVIVVSFVWLLGLYRVRAS